MTWRSPQFAVWTCSALRRRLRTQVRSYEQLRGRNRVRRFDNRKLAECNGTRVTETPPPPRQDRLWRHVVNTINMVTPNLSTRRIISAGGLTWKCAARLCTAAKKAAPGTLARCIALAKRIGGIRSYSYQGPGRAMRRLLAQDLRACNPKVPNVIGKPWDVAKRELVAAGYRRVDVRPQEICADDPRLEKVANQAPRGGAFLDLRRNAIIWVYRKGARASMPKIVGDQQDVAERALRRAGLRFQARVLWNTPTIRLIPGSSAAVGTRGKVTFQNPTKGCVAALKRRRVVVRFHVTRYGDRMQVPDVRGLSCANAFKALLRRRLSAAVLAFRPTNVRRYLWGVSFQSLRPGSIVRTPRRPRGNQRRHVPVPARYQDGGHAYIKVNIGVPRDFAAMIAREQAHMRRNGERTDLMRRLRDNFSCGAVFQARQWYDRGRGRR